MNNALDIFSPETKKWFEETLGEPTEVQKTAWEPISKGDDVLVSAPTGTGKTLTAFLVFIDKLLDAAKNNSLEKELSLIYISPLKSLAGDIRENLKKPLDGITKLCENTPCIKVSMRTGDTSQSERRAMLKTPPQILITTPESLFLLLSSVSGQKLLSTAKAIILDELHVMIDSKRGTHLMLSLARLDKLCGKPLQRIGLSATIHPLSRAAEYLSPRNVSIAAPKMSKAIEINIISPFAGGDDESVTLWDDLSKTVYEYCSGKRSVIAFLEGRAYAEKLSYYVNLLGGDGFARTHHGCLSKEQRFETENLLRNGELRLLCATSSMELGIDVGDIDEVFQVGCPATVSSTIQRLGRAGHNPGRTSRMFMFPRTSWEGLYCALTAEVARSGKPEPLKPPTNCLDILAQHLVSMAVGGDYTVDDVMEILPSAFPYKATTRNDVCDVLEMLAGDYEHNNDIPARPRIIYDRIHGRVEGDTYSRMLAVSSGGTIPDRGMYAAKTEGGAKVGELDEEFVFESRVGDRFRLGTFTWQIADIKKDTVVVKPSSGSARIPFWHNEWRGRGIETGIQFGELLRRLNRAHEKDKDSMLVELYNLGLDELAAKSANNFLRRQFASTGTLPDDKTVIAEHFTDDAGKHQVMFHSVFGRQVNAPLSALVHEAASRISGLAIGCVDMDDGFLLYTFGGEPLPKGLFKMVNSENPRQVLETMLPSMPMFSILFRYNIARSLLTGVKNSGRMPLWLQRIKSAQVLDSVIGYKAHPIVRETKRECLDDLWDLAGMERVLNGIISGAIRVVEITHETASPMSLPCRWAIEAAVMYDYSPVTGKVEGEVAKELTKLIGITPAAEQLAAIGERVKLPNNEKELHTLLMIEGDLTVSDLPVPPETLVSWLESLAVKEQAVYTESGLWVAAEQEKDYSVAFSGDDAALKNIIRRTLRYRGAKSSEEISSRYSIPVKLTERLLNSLVSEDFVIIDNGIYYHTELYNRARSMTIKKRRESETLPAENYAAFMASRTRIFTSPDIQLEKTLDTLCGIPFTAEIWESTILPSRVDNYSPAMLDALLAGGEFYWQFSSEENNESMVVFHRTDGIDWDKEIDNYDDLNLGETELIIYEALIKRGASFMQGLSRLIGNVSPYEPLLSLVKKGLVTSDNFIPVRQIVRKNKLDNAVLKYRIAARVTALTSGRWDIVRPQTEENTEQKLRRAFKRNTVISRETIIGLSWSEALEKLRIWEYTGQVRRGYYINGLSGAQFILAEDYDTVSLALKNPAPDIVWLRANDPFQMWGKALAHNPERQFVNVPGTAVALHKGLPVAVMERQGKTLRIFDYDYLSETLEAFKNDFKNGKVFPERNSITIKDYPKSAENALANADFSRQMLDYVLYKRNL